MSGTEEGARMRMRPIRKMVLAGLTASALVLTPLGEATAHNFNAPTTSSIRTQKRVFRGRVKSTRKFCLRKRVVTVFKKKSGPDKKIGSDISIGGGYWKVRKRPTNGRFYARVARKKFKKYGHSHRCQAGSSPTIRVRNR